MKKIGLILLSIMMIAGLAFVGCGDDSSSSTSTVAVENIELNRHTATIGIGETEQLSVTFTPENATNKTVIWESDDPAIATVSSSGLVTGVAEGSVWITVETPCGEHYDECEITVLPEGAVRVTGVTLNKDTLELTAGDTDDTLVATIEPDDADDPTGTWSSDDPTVATVNINTGLVTAVSAGTAIITFTTNDGGFTDDCEVTVSAYPVFKVDGNGDPTNELDIVGTTTTDTVILPYDSQSNVTVHKAITNYLLTLPDTYFLRIVLKDVQTGSATVAQIGNSPDHYQLIARYSQAVTDPARGHFVSYGANRNVNGNIGGDGHFDIPMSVVKTSIGINGGDLRFQVVVTGRCTIDAMFVLPPCDGNCEFCADDCTDIPDNAPCMCPGCFSDGPGTHVPHTFCVCCIPAPSISITTQPTNKEVEVGYTTAETFSVVAAINHGTGSLAYQWYSNATNSNEGGTSIGGATNATFNIPAALAEGDYYYYVVVSAPELTSVTSNAVRFRVSAGIDPVKFNLTNFLAGTHSYQTFTLLNDQSTGDSGSGDTYINTTFASRIGQNRITGSNSSSPPLKTGSGNRSNVLILVNPANDGLLYVASGTTHGLEIMLADLDLDLTSNTYSITISGTVDAASVSTGTMRIVYNGWSTTQSLAASSVLTPGAPFEISTTLVSVGTNPTTTDDVLRIRPAAGAAAGAPIILHITSIVIEDVTP